MSDMMTNLTMFFFRLIFNRGWLSKEFDVFKCFQPCPSFEPSSELHPMDPCGNRKYTEDEDNGDAPSATAIGKLQLFAYIYLF